MVAYAKGKYARAMCDRCGWEVPYLDLKTEWTGLRVCRIHDCWDPKHPQLNPRHTVDAEMLHNPRRDNDTEA